MNLTQLNERLDQIQSEITRTRNGRMVQLSSEVQEIRLRIAAFIGAPPTPDAQPETIIPLATLEKAAILNAVSRCRDKHLAADALGIGKTTLYRKLAEYEKDAAA
jgi:transcriptional regulator with PAS, ATPase and Fis domain